MELNTRQRVHQRLFLSNHPTFAPQDLSRTLASEQATRAGRFFITRLPATLARRASEGELPLDVAGDSPSLARRASVRCCSFINRPALSKRRPAPTRPTEAPCANHPASGTLPGASSWATLKLAHQG